MKGIFKPLFEVMSVVLALLVAASMLFVFGCDCGGSGDDGGSSGPSGDGTLVKSYSYIWDATDDAVEHDTGNIAIDDGWGAVLDTAAGNLCSAEIGAKLNAQAYTAVARLLCNDSKKTSKKVAAVLRVVDENGKELGRRNVRICDFDEKLTYQDFDFTFPVTVATNATFEIYWPGTDYVRVSQFGIISKTVEDLPDFTETGKALLGTEIEEESEITFSENSLYVFDLYDYMLNNAADAEAQYDIANLVCTLQGLVNRDGKTRLFVRFMQGNQYAENTDMYWLNHLTADGAWLSDKTVVNVKSPMTLLKLFSDSYNGFAAWDPEIPATVNAVATACGVDGLLPVRYSNVRNSLYWYIQNSSDFASKPLKIDLGGKFTGTGKIYQTNTASTGSRKNDAYVWAKEKYLDTHKTNSHMMAYHVDAFGSNTVFAAYSDLQNMFLSNRDYYISNKAFFFDLSPMEFEIPDDDPDQQDLDLNEVDCTIDYSTFTSIMLSQSSYANSVDSATPIEVGGFTPWHLKYTKYTNPAASGEVTCEWETVYQFSIYNAYINADAPGYTAMANASVYQSYPMQASYTQKGSKTIKESLRDSNGDGYNFLIFYVGDFDASAWLNTAMIKFWNDENRGKIPLCWTFSLNISKRAGHVVDWMYSTATEKDYFVAGDNGVGYLNPEAYADARSENVYGDLNSWAAYNKPVYQRFDIDYTGFLITRQNLTQNIAECYAKFCKGTATNGSYVGGDVNGFEIVSSFDYASVSDLVSRFNVKKGTGSGSTFKQVRFVLRSPTDLYNLYTQLTTTYADYNFKVVDPYTFYGLMAQQ